MNSRHATYTTRLRAYPLKALQVLLALGWACVAPVFSAEADDPAFEVSGQITFWLDHYGKAQRSETNRFQMVVDECQWNLKLLPVSPLPCDYREMAYDGNWIYSVISLKTVVQTALRTNPAPVSASNVATASINTGPVPHDQFIHEAGVLWLMFGSACYFRDRPGGATEPVVTFGGPDWVYGYKNPYKQTTVYRLQELAPAVPAWLAYLDEGHFRVPDDERVKIPRPPPYDRGFTNSVFEVLCFTNCGALHLPAEAVLTTFVPHRNGGTSSRDLYLYTKYRVSVGTVRGLPAPPTTFKPAVPGTTVVSDYRFGVSRAGSYMSTAWLTTGEATNTGKIPPPQPVAAKPGPARLLVLAVMAGLALIPLAFWLLRTVHAVGKPGTSTQTE